MKKSTKILLNVCIVLIFVVCIVILGFSIKALVTDINCKSTVQEEFDEKYPFGIRDFMMEASSSYRNEVNKYLSEISNYNYLIIQNSIIVSLTVIAAIASGILFKIFAYNNFATDWEQNKVARTERKRQKRIEQLQAELEELKKDE